MGATPLVDMSGSGSSPSALSSQQAGDAAFDATGPSAAQIGQGAGAGGGLLLGGIGAIFQMQAEATATAEKVQADKTNAQLALGQAGSVISRGQFEAQQAQLKGGQVVGAERAGFGASGVDANTGSAAAVQAASHAVSSLDATQAMNNAMRSAWGYQVTANQYGAQAGVDKQLGQDQEIGTALGAVGGAMGGAGQMIGMLAGV